MKKIGVVLSGCGVFDGSEIHETVLTLLALDREGFQALCMAPDIDQGLVINHLNQKPEAEKRNVLAESARIARGEIRNIADVQSSEVDALFFPGGFGAAKNLCSFADDGDCCDVNPEVERLTWDVMKEGKPVAAVCIAPALIAAIARNAGIETELTIGNDRTTAAVLEKMGARHFSCRATDVTVDSRNKIITGPAYMLGAGIYEVSKNIDSVVSELASMLEN